MYNQNVLRSYIFFPEFKLQFLDAANKGVSVLMISESFQLKGGIKTISKPE